MKKLLVVLCTLALASFASAQTTVTIGAGANPGNTFDTKGPIYRSAAASLFDYSQHLILYTAADMAAAGIPNGATITKLAWNKSSAFGTTAGNNTDSFKIFLHNSTLSGVASLFGNSFNTLVAPATLVYAKGNQIIPTSTGYVVFDFSTNPFTYNGGSLEIGVSWDCSIYSGNPSTGGYTWTDDLIANRVLGGSNSTSTISLAPVGNRSQIQITYTPPPPCTGTPNAGNAGVSPAAYCTGTPLTIYLSGMSASSNLTYQWQSTSVGGTSWSNIPGATSSTYSLPASGSFDYRCVVTCTGSGLSSNSGRVSITVPPVSYKLLPYTQNFESAWTSRCSVNDLPDTFVTTNPSNGDNSWRRDDDGNFAGWTSTLGAYIPLGAAGTSHSARFHSYDAAVGDVGLLDFHVDLSATTAGISKELSFYYNNNSGDDSLYILFSSDSGVTFTPLQAFSINTGWTLNRIPLSTGTAAKCVVRLMAVGDFGLTDIGVDQVRIYQVGPDVSVTSIVSPTSTCSGTATNPVKIVVTNSGTTLAAGTKIPVSFVFNGGSVVHDTIRLTVSKVQNDTIPFTFTGTVNLSTSGNYTLQVYTALPVDNDRTNDTLNSLIRIYGITSFPYTQSFETFDGGWEGVPLKGTVQEWEWGTPAKLVINSAANGTKCWITSLSNNYTDDIEYALVSPCIDLSTITTPKVSFSLRLLTETDYDDVILEASNDGGVTWNKVTTFSGNGYNSNSTLGNLPPPIWSGDNGGWTRYTAVIASLGSKPDCRIRFRFNSDAFVNDEGAALDSIRIENLSTDIGVSSILSPFNACTVSPVAPVKVVLTNYGIALNAGTKIPVYYKMNTNSVITDTVRLTTAKAFGDTIVFTFAATANLGSFGTYTFKVWTGLSGDVDHTNDTTQIQIGIININTFPYSESFETSNGGWESKLLGGRMNDFVWGTPAKTILNSAASGTKCWVTRLTGNYADSSYYAMQSPCIDMSTLTAPRLSFSMNSNIEMDWDGLILESSINGGLSWTKQSVFLLGNYNSTSTNGPMAPPKWSGSTGGWKRYMMALTGMAGQANCKLRFTFISDDIVNLEGVALDSISIADPPNVDIITSKLIAPVSGCGISPTVPVRVQIKNNGKLLPVGTKIPMGFKIVDFTNSTVKAATDTLILTSALATGDSLIFTFNTGCGITLTGNYLCKVWCGHNLDSDNSNDTLFNQQLIKRGIINSFPYRENFEITDGDWYGGIVGGTVNEWDWNYPSKTVINSTPNGLQCWMTAPFSNYANNSNSAMYSPCFDMSQVANPQISFIMRFVTEATNDALVLESSTNGGTTWARVDSLNTAGNYNNVLATGAFAGPKWSGNNTTWRQYSFVIPTLGLQSSVQFRFHFISNATVNNEGFAIDSIVIIDNSFDDLKMTGMNSPGNSCSLSSAETVSITVQNKGNRALAAGTVIPAGYYFNTNPVVSENFTLTNAWPVNGYVTFNFTTKANLSTGAPFTFNCFTMYAPDIDYSNDSTGNVAIKTKSVVSTFPYTESFENAAGEWTAPSIGSQWRRSSLISSPSFSPHTGSTLLSFAADSFSAGTISRAISPCFDFSSATDRLTMSLYFTQSNLLPATQDSIRILASSNNGNTWTLLRSISRYNAAYTSPLWSRFDISLAAYKTLSSVQIAVEAYGMGGKSFAIDDIQIYESAVSNTTGDYNPSANCIILNGSNWIDLRDDQGKLMGSVNPNGNNMGSTCWGFRLNSGAIRYEKLNDGVNKFNTYYFDRNLFLQPGTNPLTPISVRLYYNPSEFKTFQDTVLAKTAANITLADLNVLAYSGTNVDPNVLNNTYTASNYVKTTQKDSVSALGFNYLGFNTTKAGEFNPVFQTVVTGVTKSLKEISIVLYPNPTTGKVNIVSSEEVKRAEISDISGRVLLVTDKTEADLSTLAPGTYLMKCFTAEGMYVVKVIKQ